MKSNIVRRVVAFIKKRPPKLFYAELFIAAILLSMPLWYEFHKVFLNKELLEQYGMTSTSFGFKNDATFIFYFLQKSIPLIFLTIWLITCKYWWRPAIYIPILFLIIQTIQFIFGSDYIDEYEFFWALVISIPFLMIIVVLSNKINFFRMDNDLKIDIQSEIDELLSRLKAGNKRSITYFEIELKELKKRKHFYQEDRYIYELANLRNKILQMQVKGNLKAN